MTMATTNWARNFAEKANTQSEKAGAVLLHELQKNEPSESTVRDAIADLGLSPERVPALVTLAGEIESLEATLANYDAVAEDAAYLAWLRESDAEGKKRTAMREQMAREEDAIERARRTTVFNRGERVKSMNQTRDQLARTRAEWEASIRGAR